MWDFVWPDPLELQILHGSRTQRLMLTWCLASTQARTELLS